MSKNKIRKIITKNVLVLMEYAIRTRITENKYSFLRSIGASPENISKYVKGTIYFTHEQVYAAQQLTGADVNWIYGITTEMKLRIRKVTKDPITRIEEAIAELRAVKG